jgi:glucose-1-phosphate thymidylyltransferase
MLDHILDRFQDQQLDEYVFIIGWLGEQIEAYMEETSTIPTQFVTQEEIIGQAHALWLAREHLEGPLFMMFVDTLFDDVDFSDLDQEGLDGVIFTKRVDDPRRFGVVETDEDGWATTLIEKPESVENKTVLMGLYYFRDGARLAEACEMLIDRDIKTKGEYYLADAVNLMIEQGARFRTRPVGVWKDTGKPETTLETHRYLLEHGADNSHLAPRPGVVVIPPVFVHPAAVIEQSVIGPYVSVGKDAEVRDSILRDTIVDEGAALESVMLDSSIVGRWVELNGHFQQVNIGDSSTVT